MIVLGIDPGSEGTGFAVIRDGELIHVSSKPFSRSSKSVTLKYQLRYRVFHKYLDELFHTVCGGVLDLAACEWTDWHQRLDERTDWRKRYYRERQAQASMWFFDTAALAWCENNSIPFQLLGVTEWHAELGYRNKAVIAEQIARMYSQVFYLNDSLEAVLRKTGKVAETHVTDAVGIAHVAFSYLNIASKGIA